jgi:hypothetical protein
MRSVVEPCDGQGAQGFRAFSRCGNLDLSVSGSGYEQRSRGQTNSHRYAKQRVVDE